MIGPQPKPSPEGPQRGPQSPRTPYPADEPGPKGAGSEPDYFPGKPGNEPPKFRIATRQPRLMVDPLQAN